MSDDMKAEITPEEESDAADAHRERLKRLGELPQPNDPGGIRARNCEREELERRLGEHEQRRRVRESGGADNAEPAQVSDKTAIVYSVFLHVTHCDNKLEVFVNGRRAYEKHTDNNPLLNDQVLLQDIVAGSNQVRVIGTNGPTNPANQNNPYNFEFEILPQQNNNGAPASLPKQVYAQEHITSNGQTAAPGQVFDKTYDVHY